MTRLVVLEHVPRRHAARTLVLRRCAGGSGWLARWQDRLTPLWTVLVAGCHPKRSARAAIERAGFIFEQVDPFDRFAVWVLTRPLLDAVAVRPG